MGGRRDSLETLDIKRLLAETAYHKSHEYVRKMFAIRAEISNETIGSIYECLTADELRRIVEAALWEPYRGNPENLVIGCTAWQSKIPGRLGIVPLVDVGDEIPVRIQDPRGTGHHMPILHGVAGPVVPFSTLITRTVRGVPILLTFHPGDPVITGRFHVEHLINQTITVREARMIGYKHALVNERAETMLIAA